MEKAYTQHVGFFYCSLIKQRKGNLMKKSTLLLIIALVSIGSSALVVIKLSQKNVLLDNTQEDPTREMFKENQELINRVIALCENDDGITTFATKAWSLMKDQTKWAERYKDILKQKTELANAIDEQWMEVLYILGLSLDDEANELKKQKKAFAMEAIGKQINRETLVNYLKNKPNVNQEALMSYIKKTELTLKK